jgi:probable F420-dependent oxidoreductase
MTMNEPLEIGVTFPQTEIGDNPGEIRAYAQAVEALGYRYILAYDHVLGADVSVRPGWSGPYTSESMFHEPFVLFGYLAGITTAIGLVTGVIILPQRQTALVAKQAAEVDVLSGGRLRLGIGIGWNEVEYRALGQHFHDRGARSEEQIAVLRALWAETVITFHGRWHTIEAAGINPLPPRRTIPIWIGGYAEATLKRVARIGDGWITFRPPDETMRAAIARLSDYARDAGRDPATIGIESQLSLRSVAEDRWQAYVDGWRALGARYLCLNTMGMGLTSVDQHIAVLQRAAETLGISATDAA